MYNERLKEIGIGMGAGLLNSFLNIDFTVMPFFMALGKTMVLAAAGVISSHYTNKLLKRKRAK